MTHEIDPFDALTDDRGMTIFKSLRATADVYLAKAGFPRPNPDDEDDDAKEFSAGAADGALREGGDSTSAGADEQVLADKGVQSAAAGQEAQGEDDPIEGMTDDDDDSPEEVTGDAAAATAADAEQDPIEALADDEGEEAMETEDGDLDEDGSVQSLAMELASLEKDYYAARGLHGDGSGKASVVLDKYHRAVRKLVRMVSNNTQAPASPEEPAPGEAPPAQSPGKAPPAPASEGPAPKGPPKPPGAQGQPPQAQKPGGPPKPPGKPPGAPAAPAGDEGGDDDKKKPPFGKSSDFAISTQPRGAGRLVKGPEYAQCAPEPVVNPFVRLAQQHRVIKSTRTIPAAGDQPCVPEQSASEKYAERARESEKGILGHLSTIAKTGAV